MKDFQMGQPPHRTALQSTRSGRSVLVGEEGLQGSQAFKIEIHADPAIAMKDEVTDSIHSLDRFQIVIIDGQEPGIMFLQEVPIVAKNFFHIEKPF
jgi:hypothetical protein